MSLPLKPPTATDLLCMLMGDFRFFRLVRALQSNVRGTIVTVANVTPMFLELQTTYTFSRHR
jgi:hypothetical protein